MLYNIYYTFERVNSFKYLGSTVTHNNNISDEIRICHMTANRAYFALIRLLKSRLLSRKTKMQIYKMLISPNICLRNIDLNKK
jgi:hypothetical protein